MNHLEIIANAITIGAEQRARQIFNKFHSCTKDKDIAKYCSIIHVLGIQKELKNERVFERVHYWDEVREEITKL